MRFESREEVSWNLAKIEMTLLVHSDILCGLGGRGGREERRGGEGGEKGREWSEQRDWGGGK